MTLTVGIVGAGIIAKEHLDALMTLKRRFRLVGIADIDDGKLNRIKESYRISTYLDYQKMIRDLTPDVVVITLPHFLHKEAAVYAANQGCHILLEKPMALNQKECEEIIKAAHTNGVKLLVGHIQHYFEENNIAKNMIKEKFLGELVMVNETRHMDYFTHDRPSWFLNPDQSGGGIIFNIGVHCIDKIQWVLNTRFSKLFSKLTFPSRRVEGSGLIWMESEEGIPITVSISGYEGVPQHATDFIFNKGMMRVEAGKGVWISKGKQYNQIYSSEKDTPFEKQWMELVSAIESNGSIENNGAYGRSIIEVVEAIYQSDRQGKMVFLQQPAVSEKGLK